MLHHINNQSDVYVGIFGAVATYISEKTGQPFWLSCTIGCITAIYISSKTVSVLIDIRHKLKHRKVRKTEE